MSLAEGFAPALPAAVLPQCDGDRFPSLSNCKFQTKLFFHLVALVMVFYHSIRKITNISILC